MERGQVGAMTLDVDMSVLALDIGSSSVRAMVFDRNARAVRKLTAQLPYELDTTADGGVTLDADGLLRLVEQCVDDVVARTDGRRRIGAVGISCFWHSLLGVDDGGNPVMPVLHLADSRSADIVDELRQTEDEAVCRRIGGTVFHSSYWPAKLRWLRESDPATFASVARWSSAPDYVFARLTGSSSSSVCMASGTGMLDISHCEWSAELATVAGVTTDSLPALVDGRAIAALHPDYADRWPELNNAAWYPPLGDGACANVGSSAHGPGRIAMTLGTTGAMRVLVESPAGQDVEPVDGLWTYRLDRRSILRGAAITNGGVWIDFLRELLGDADHDLLEAAFLLPPAGHGLTVLPYLAGERAPLWNDRARAVVAGLHAGTTREELVRAGAEAVAHSLRLIYDLVATVATPDHLIVANGAALLRSDGLQQIVASDLEHPVVTLPDNLEASARGAAMCTMVNAGVVASFDDFPDLVDGSPVVEPDTGESALYRGERERGRRLQSLLYPNSGSWDRS